MGCDGTGPWWESGPNMMGGVRILAPPLIVCLLRSWTRPEVDESGVSGEGAERCGCESLESLRPNGGTEDDGDDDNSNGEGDKAVVVVVVVVVVIVGPGS